jgi:hypothetical protein
MRYTAAARESLAGRLVTDEDYAETIVEARSSSIP